jgi:EAL domain-containing protein (putative c-di-GMP-specific phosphodiesterase class I)
MTDGASLLDAPAGHPLRRFADALDRRDGLLEARHQTFVVRSAYQPIYSFAHGRPVGFEALARAQGPDGRPVSPAVLLGSEPSLDGTVHLDRLLRALHAGNFHGPPFDGTWLFLNVSPLVVIQGRSSGPFFGEMLRASGIPPHRVVVEITETGTDDENVLEGAAAYYRKLGCLVAIDDFGMGHSNFNRLWRLKPDIVKLDRSMVVRAGEDVAARRALVGITGILHEIGALVVAEGVETEAEARAAVQAEADLFQGYWFTRPFIGRPPKPDGPCPFERLRGDLNRHARDEESEFAGRALAYVEAFERAGAALAAGTALPEAARPALALEAALRIYLLDANGAQAGENVVAARVATAPDPRHAPLHDARGASWSHRHYFRRALANPGRTQTSRPYLSLTDPGMCVTLSRTVQVGGAPRVLCFDLSYPL